MSSDLVGLGSLAVQHFRVGTFRGEFEDVETTLNDGSRCLAGNWPSWTLSEEDS